MGPVMTSFYLKVQILVICLLSFFLSLAISLSFFIFFKKFFIFSKNLALFSLDFLFLWFPCFPFHWFLLCFTFFCSFWLCFSLFLLVLVKSLKMVNFRSSFFSNMYVFSTISFLTKSLQSDSLPPYGLEPPQVPSVHGTPQARILEW